jgi:hypothetical protein
MKKKFNKSMDFFSTNFLNLVKLNNEKIVMPLRVKFVLNNHVQ